MKNYKDTKEVVTVIVSGYRKFVVKSIYSSNQPTICINSVNCRTIYKFICSLEDIIKDLLLLFTY